jgi:hypothetical protein
VGEEPNHKTARKPGDLVLCKSFNTFWLSRFLLTPCKRPSKEQPPEPNMYLTKGLPLGLFWVKIAS